MKKIGTRKEVFYRIALKTSGGMTREDIIKSIKNKPKKVYLSKKISSRMKETSPLITYRKNKNSKKTEKDLGRLNVSDLKEKLLRERKLLRLRRRKLKSLKGKGIKKKKEKSKKLTFALNKNKTREFYCSSLNGDYDDYNEYDSNDIFSNTNFSGYETDDEDNLEHTPNTNHKEFKIEEPPEISLDELFI